MVGVTSHSYLAQPDADEDATHTRPDAAAESDGVSAGRDAYQAVQCSERSARCQRASHAAGFGRGETEPKKLVALGDDRLKCTQEQLVDALTGLPFPRF
jgi:hypothetical protein